MAAILVLAIAAIAAQSVALAGFALDSLIEIGTSTVVLLPSSRRHRHIPRSVGRRAQPQIIRPAVGAQ